MSKTYISGDNTKKNILKESKKLFFKQGFKNTTYADISKAAKVNRALIPYHYTNKEVLGQAVYSSILDEFMQHFDEILDIDEFSPDFVSILHLVAYYELLKNKHFSQFVAELQVDESFSSFLKEKETQLMSGFLNSAKKISDSEKNILIISETGMKKEIIQLINDNPKIEIAEIAKVQLAMLLGYSGYKQKDIQELYDSATQVIELMEFKITNQFHINISYK